MLIYFFRPGLMCLVTTIITPDMLIYLLADKLLHLCKKKQKNIYMLLSVTANESVLPEFVVI